MKWFANLLAVIVLCTGTFASAGQNVVVVLDDSGSMDTRMRLGETRRIEAAKTALSAVLKDLPADTNLGVILLNGSWEPSQWLIPLGPVQKDRVTAVINGVSPTGGTPLGGCMKAGCDVLLQLREKQRYGTYRLLIVTDGEAGDQNLVEQYLPDILSRGIFCDCIGVDMASTHSLATKVHNYREANNAEQLQQALKATFAETGGTDSKSDEDFAMIASIPDGMAGAMLKALSIGGNHPIGEIREASVDAQGNIKLTTASTPASVSSVGTVVWTVLVVLAVVIIVIAIAVKAGQSL